MAVSTAKADDFLSELKSKRKKAIEALDFDAAEDYDRQIRGRQGEVIDNRVSDIFNEIIRDVEAHILKYNAIENDIRKFESTQRTNLRQSYQGLLDCAQLQQEKELNSIDKSHANFLLKETSKEVPEQIDLLKQAKAAASAGQFPDAKRMRDAARAIGEAELENRKQRIDEEYDQARSMLSARAQDALNRISKKYEDEINDLESEVQMRKLETKQRFDGGIKLIRQRAEIRCKALVAEEDVKEDALFEVNRKIDSILMNPE